LAVVPENEEMLIVVPPKKRQTRNRATSEPPVKKPTKGDVVIKTVPVSTVLAVAKRKARGRNRSVEFVDNLLPLVGT
jgi:hypothetical protein